jgi:hypothetical protein
MVFIFMLLGDFGNDSLSAAKDRFTGHDLLDLQKFGHVPQHEFRITLKAEKEHDGSLIVPDSRYEVTGVHYHFSDYFFTVPHLSRNSDRIITNLIHDSSILNNIFPASFSLTQGLDGRMLDGES